MKETKELFEQTILLKDFDEQSYEELILLRNRLSEFINKISIAKRDAYYFEYGPELPTWAAYRESCYDEIFADGIEIKTDSLNLSSNTQKNVLSLYKNMRNINHKKEK